MNEQDGGERMQPDEENPAASSNGSLSAGAQLAAARERHGWSIDDVAAQLNLAPRQVAAIEANNHAALPGISVTRGFIRAYAKLVKIDAAPLLAGLGDSNLPQGQARAPRPINETPFAASRLPSLGQRKRSFMPLVAVAIALLLAAGGYWLLQQRGVMPPLPGSDATQIGQDKDVNPSGAVPHAAEELAPSMTTEPLAPPEAVPSAPAGTGTSPAAPLPEVAPGAGQPSSEAATPATDSATPQAADTASVPPPAATQGEDLRLIAREESWVEIKRVNGNGVLYARLMKPGESHAVPVTEPLALVVGNAAGVDLTLRGASLPLKTGSGNVSRITVK